MARKVRTLHDVHQWIADTTSFFSTPDGEDEVKIDAEDAKREPYQDIVDIEAALVKVHEAINEFDCAFHDKFDCR